MLNLCCTQENVKPVCFGQQGTSDDGSEGSLSLAPPRPGRKLSEQKVSKPPLEPPRLGVPEDTEQGLGENCRWRDCQAEARLDASGAPGADPTATSGDQAERAQCTGAVVRGRNSSRRTSLVPLQLHRPSYRCTFICSAVSCVYLFLGLLTLGLGARLQHSIGSMCCRLLAWSLLYMLPVVCASIVSIRSLYMYGVQPQGVAETFVYGVSGKSICAAAAKNGVRSSMAFVVPFFKLASNVLNWCFHCVYLGEKYQYPGFVLVYGVGPILFIPLERIFMPKFLPPIDMDYVKKCSPRSLGVTMVAFFVMTSGFAIAKRHLGEWLGLALPIFLSIYEGLGTWLIGRFFVKDFVLKEVRTKMGQMQQEILPSIVILLLQCMSQGARSCLLVAGAGHDPTDRGWMLSLASALACNVMLRSHWMDKWLFLLCGDYWRMDNFYRLQMLTKFQAGYPPIVALFCVGMVRAALGNPVVPNSTTAFVIAGIAAEHILEDVIVLAAGYFDLLPVFPTVEPNDVELRARACRIDANEVLGDPQVRARLSESMDAEFLAWDCQYNLRSVFPELPLWAHFSAIMISVFFTLLFLILLGGGLNFVLGFCSEPGYGGVGRGIVWWPVMEISDPCGGEDF
eukprot:CAMPEP_0203885854 /NCGR_PEP_ID=MMETSP0359-20131031/29720_1 /ASSEMBLY_ACC=CAM_ASM_000338 /TAXON_ID=268821 /ORGANISM="Scrippsiella Hangoei, Strain SHTV-5" /LENGTH=623 /DNA_ID=CAMNT_0050806553 /DNA_START=9 /DNA_END=1880 /DNA_ORIENTATION=+